MNTFVWKPRLEPLQPLGLLITKDQREKVKRRLLEMEDNHLLSLRGSYSKNAVVILGDQGKLPWVPGGIYLGKVANAPHLYIPTLLTPSIPIDLLDAAVVREFGEGQFVINPWLKQVYNLSKALSLSRHSLERNL